MTPVNPYVMVGGVRIRRIDGNPAYWGYIDVDEWSIYGPLKKGAKGRWVDVFKPTRMNFLMNHHYEEYAEYWDWLPDR